MSGTTGLDKTRRYLRPVARLRLPEEPDLVHLSVYEWLTSFQAWATGPALCGRSTSQGPLPSGTEVTCPSCLAYRPKYETALDLQAGSLRTRVAEVTAEGTLLEQVQKVVKASGLKQKWIAQQLHTGEKHLSHLLNGRVTMTLAWAERIVNLCGMELVVAVRPWAGGGR